MEINNIIFVLQHYAHTNYVNYDTAHSAKIGLPLYCVPHITFTFTVISSASWCGSKRRVCAGFTF